MPKRSTVSKGSKTPKAKTHRGATKRFKVTGSGKVLRSQIGKGHLLEKKTTKRKRQLKKTATISSTDRKKVKRLIGL